MQQLYYQIKFVFLNKQKELAKLIIQKTSFPENTITVNSDKVILNIPTKSLEKLSRDSVIFTEISSDVEKAYKLFVPVPSGKIYGFYERAWWNVDLDLTHGEMSTTNDLRYFEWSDGVVECNGQNCKGYVMMAYPTGDYMQFFRNPQENKYSPKVIISTNTSFLLELHRLFVESKTNLLKEKDIDPSSILPPKIIAMGLWDVAWYYTPVSSFKGGDANALILKPLSYLDIYMDIYLVNEAYGPIQGWLEASLITAEKVLYLMNIPRPN